MEAAILYETDSLGIAYTSVSPGYACNCALECIRAGELKERALFHSVDEGNAAACFAVGVFGGYDRANVLEAEGESPTHATWEDWICHAN